MMYHFLIFSFSLFPFVISSNILFLLSSSFPLCFLRHPFPSLIIRISIPSTTPPPFSFLPLFLPSLSFSSSLSSLLISPLFQSLLFPRLRLCLCIFPVFLHHVTSNSCLFGLFFPFPFSLLRLLPLMGHSQKANMDTPGRRRGIISSKYSQSKFISKRTKFSSSTLQEKNGVMGMGIDFLFLIFLYSISFIPFPSSSSSSFPLLPFFLPLISFSSAIPSLPLLTSPRFLYRLFPSTPPPPLRYLDLSFPFLSIPFSFLRLLLSMVRTCKWNKYPDLPVRFLFAPHNASNCSPKHPGIYPNWCFMR